MEAMAMSQALTTLCATPIPTTITTKSQLAPSTASSNAKTPPTSLDLQPSTPFEMASVSVQRRNIMKLAITGAIIGLTAVEKKAWAAARRPPPPTAGEKKDPNISGVQAKVLASKKRKEAMKQAMADQRARGKSTLEQ